MLMCREGQRQTSPAIIPKTHLDYLDPRVKLATQEFNKGAGNKVSLVIK